MKNKFVKTFLLRWNPTISGFSLDAYCKAVSEYPDGFGMGWAIYEWEQAHEGDFYYMLRTGDENAGIVFMGTFTSEPYEADDWAGTTNKKHYVDIDCYDYAPADKKPALDVETLEKNIPEIDWRNGHSGELLSPDIAQKLAKLYGDLNEQRWDEDDVDEEVFDDNPSHGDHWESVCDSSDLEDSIIGFAKILTRRGKPCLKGEIEEIDGHGNRVNIPTIGINYIRDGVGIQGVIVCREDSNELKTIFPAFYDGTEIELQLTRIDEFESGIEAVLTGENAHGDLSFHDIDYYARKSQYKIGEKYTFQIAALALNSETVPKEEWEFKIEGEDAVKFYTAPGDEVKYLKDGSVKPITIAAKNLVALLQNNDAYPSCGEFQSPVQGRAKTIDFWGCPLYRIPILVLRDEESEGTEIPLYAKVIFFDHKPKKGEPIRGHLWLMGRLKAEY